MHTGARTLAECSHPYLHTRSGVMTEVRTVVAMLLRAKDSALGHSARSVAVLIEGSLGGGVKSPRPA